VWRDSFIRVSRLSDVFDMTNIWLIEICDMTHGYVWQDSWMCVTRLIDICHMTHGYNWQDCWMCVTWLIEICDMTHGYVWHHSHRHTRFCTRAFWRERPYQSQRTAFQKLLLMSLARPVSAKEPYIYTKRALCTCKRASYTHQKLLLMSLARRVSAKEPDVYPERALYMHQKSPIRTPREPCVHAREPHIHTRSCSRRRWQGL